MDIMFNNPNDSTSGFKITENFQYILTENVNVDCSQDFEFMQ